MAEVSISEFCMRFSIDMIFQSTFVLILVHIEILNTDTLLEGFNILAQKLDTKELVGIPKV